MQLPLEVPERVLRGVNDIRDEDRPVHSWYNFVLSYPPHLVREYVERFEIVPGDTVLDPFCGTGTTPVECKKLGIGSTAIEAIPVVHFAASTKADWAVSPKHLLEHARDIASEARGRLRDQGLEGDATHSAADVSLRTVSAEEQRLLIKNSISPLPLHRTLVLLDIIEEKRVDEFYSHELLALASVLPTEIGNLRFGPEVGVGSMKADAPVIHLWLTEVETMATDLVAVQDRADVPTTIRFGDARSPMTVLGPNTIDAVITSPPYPNEKDYTRIVRMESVLLGFMSDRKELRSTKEELLRSNTRNAYVADTDDIWIEDFNSVQEVAEQIEERRIELEKDSGFEKLYPRVTKLYFGGMLRHLRDLRHALRPGARLAYVVGDQASYLRIMIRTGQILAEIADALGYEVIGIDLFRERAATATRSRLREEVVLLRWPGEGSRGGRP